MVLCVQPEYNQQRPKFLVYVYGVQTFNSKMFHKSNYIIHCISMVDIIGTWNAWPATITKTD